MLRKKNRQSTKFVIRIDSDTTHGYQTRIPIKGEQVTKLFSDGIHGGKMKARKAAISHRDSECKRLGIEYHRTRVIHRRDRRSSTGIVGVSRVCVSDDGKTCTSYIASWTPRPGQRQKRKSFSVKKYGERKARQLATEYRRQKEKQIICG